MNIWNIRKLKSHIVISIYETKVLLLLRKGYTNEEISDKLGKSPNTIKYHLKRIYKKLGTKNRVEAVNKFNILHKNNEL